MQTETLKRPTLTAAALAITTFLLSDCIPNNLSIKEKPEMKENYQELEMEVITFDSRDIIITSGEGEGDDDID
jgi:hypothetical protein